ncbi:MAG TPA: biotin/lipoyl-containing protein, partial [Pseudogracilibacillus sp.]|nr:biotin/lipoyl-containing protein [Pseudogracilibacillus sp.]
MAKQKILMPKLGESVTEGTINTWLINEGDIVEKYDPIAEVTTDKVNAEVPSSYSGKIVEIVAKEGTTVAVDDLICYIETEEVSTDARTSEDEAPSQAQETKERK